MLRVPWRTPVSKASALLRPAMAEFAVLVVAFLSTGIEPADFAVPMSVEL